jgi:oligopeptide transport system ATP-binding protein
LTTADQGAVPSASATRSSPIAELKHVHVDFPVRGQRGRAYLHAVDGVSLSVQKGETLGLVGETGSGKSTTGLALLRLVSTSAGQVWIRGEDVTTYSRRKMRPLRRQLAMVFQDPQAALNPRRTVGASIAEPLDVYDLCTSGVERDARIRELLDLVGLSAEVKSRYPHELSGGQRQRVCVARALAVDPELIVLDEPLASLDVSVQAQIMNLLLELQQALDLTYLFIAHDLAAVAHMSDRIAVMYLGRIVEMAPADALYRNPQHPYTRALLAAIPADTPSGQREQQRRRHDQLMSGEAPSQIDLPTGCRFLTRCPIASEQCAVTDPPNVIVGAAHQAACLHVEAASGFRGDSNLRS